MQTVRRDTGLYCTVRSVLYAAVVVHDESSETGDRDDLSIATVKRIPTLVHLDADQREQLIAVARENERSMTAEVRFALARHLSQFLSQST